MDLSEISRERTLVDLAVARVRILDLTTEMEGAAAELAELRAELAEARPAVEAGKSRSSVSPGSFNDFGLSRLSFWRRSDGRNAVHWHVDEICGESPSRSKRGIEHVVLYPVGWCRMARRLPSLQRGSS